MHANRLRPRGAEEVAGNSIYLLKARTDADPAAWENWIAARIVVRAGSEELSA